MQAKTETDEELCELCTQPHTAAYRDDQGRPVCGVHANALEDGSWDGDIHDVTPIAPDAEYVFVYGTLVNGTGYDATVHGFRKDDTGNYPTLIPDGHGEVEGEIHKVTPDRLRQLDRYEGVGSGLYTRVELPMGIQVYIGDPERLGSHGDFTFERELLQEAADRVELTIRGDIDSRTMPVQGISP